MKSLIRATLTLVILGRLAQSAFAVESTWNYAVQVSAAVQSSPAQIALSWPQDTSTMPASYSVSRKAPGATAWGAAVALAGTALGYVDTSVAVGTAYEYKIVKDAGSFSGYGYIQAGIDVPLVESRGKVVLIVDNTYATALGAELARLQQDLAGDGWTVLRHDVNRTDSVASVKALVQSDYNADPAKVKSVFLFGHVPVPYSGELNPDGHPDHVGAWPADVYYGNMNGTWTDSSVNYTQSVNTDPADAARLTNKPGDGKFDQTTIPGTVELQVGRVDLANMPGRTTWGGPATFPSELELLHNYLNKAHNFRHRIMQVQRRAIVGDYFGVRSGEAFAASGFRNAAPFFGANGITNLNTAYNDQKGVWIPTLSGNDYLFAYGCGAGSYASIGGLGNVGQYNDTNTVELVNNNIQAVFTLLFGSWLGDWDHEDNILRSVLATPSHGLAAAWSGRPHWFMHPMGLGETIGATARLTQNNNGLYQNQINRSANLIHVALMGDPTLRLHPVAPPATLGGTLGDSTATLTWTPSPDSVLGYHVYRAISASGPFTRLTSALQTATNFVDSSAPSDATYMVRAVKLESTPSGTYYNASQGLFWTTGGAPVPTLDTTPPTVSLTAPAGSSVLLGTSVTFSANATDDVGVVGVQFKLDGNNLGGEVLAAPFNYTWDTTAAANGPHTLTAVARDAAGNTATATAVSVTVSNLSTVTIAATDTNATIGTSDHAVVTFTRTGSTAAALTVNYTLSGSAVKWNDYRTTNGDMPVAVTIPAGSTSATMTIVAFANSTNANPENAVFTLASDPTYTVGSASSATLTFLSPISMQPTVTTDTVWIDDALPAGSWGSSTGGDAWTWVASSPAPFSGTKAHQTNVASGIHEHSLNGATATLTVGTGETLFTHIYLDPANVPTEVMLSFNANNWEHRAYWGANTITYGTDGTASRYRVGNLPAAGQWVRLEVPASALGLEGQSLTGMSFSLVGGRATWDKTGKASAAPVIPLVTVAATDTTATIGTADNAVLTFSRTGSTSAALTVNYTLGGTAVKWNDYRTTNGDMPVAITIPPGAASATMTIVGVANSTNANPETAVFTLATDPAYTLGAGTSATLTLVDSAAPPPPVVTLDLTSIPAVNDPDYLDLEQPIPGDNGLRIVAPTVLELQRINSKASSTSAVDSWDFVSSTGTLNAPAASKFVVTVDGTPVSASSVGFKRRPLYAPLAVRMLRIENSLYLKLAAAIPDGATVAVINPDASLWPATMLFTATAHPLRYSPAIHVNQEGYVPTLAKKAAVGFYLGNLGELDVPANTGFQIVHAATGSVAFSGVLTARPDTGWTYSPTPYQKVCEADFSAFTTPGKYYLAVPGLGASVPFKIDEGIPMSFARAYALGLYHQRCGCPNAMPFTRFTHDACHTAPSAVPSPASSFAFTWTTIASYANNLNPNNPTQTAPRLTSEAAQLYPFVNQGTLDVSGGHHDAGDYSKYTINSASLIHELMFAVDSVPGIAALDNLGTPESGDGISDIMQEAKWEADFLAKMQDADGGFYFLVYPLNREYESNVTPDQGDAQVVWPKNTAATAAATAALAEIASSPKFKAAYPQAAAAYLAKAQLGWQFLTNAIAQHGKAGAYQKLTHYGDDFTHDDELAWAAAAMFAATGDTIIHNTLKSWFDPSNPANWRWGWWHGYMGFGNAERSYAFAATSGRLAASVLDSAYLAKCQAEVIAAGDDSTKWAGESAYGTSFPTESKHVQSAGWYFSGTQAFDIAAASAITAKTGYLDAILRNMNYEGGNNPLNLSYVTGLGTKRQHEIVHQYAQNDRRDLPPTGIPLGNLQTGPVYTATYGTELAALVFPSDSAGTSPYPFYDRWSDTFNVTTEFVHLDTARSLVAYASVAAQTSLQAQAWTPVAGTITGLPATLLAGTPVTATLTAPAGIDLAGATIVWEAAMQPSHYGPSFTFTPTSYGQQFVEVEATLPDGRRIFAVQNFFADNVLPNVTVVATDATASISNSSDTAVFTFTRTGDTSQPLVVNYSLTGSAVKWNDYRRPQGDMPVSLTIPAGAASATLTIYAVANTTNANPETVIVTVTPTANSYNAGSPAFAQATLTP